MTIRSWMYTLLTLFAVTPLVGWAQKAPIFDFKNYNLQKVYLDVQQEDKDIWIRKEHDCEEEIPASLLAYYKHVPKYSQSNLQAMAAGGVRLAVMSITIPERPYFKNPALNSKNFSGVTRCLAGYQRSMQAYAAPNTLYYEELVHYLRFVESIDGDETVIAGRNYDFRFLKSTKQLQEVSGNPTSLGGLLHIYGGHCLGHSDYIESDKVGSEEFKAFVLTNLERLKGSRPLVEQSDEYLSVPVFYMTLASDFPNGFGGDIPFDWMDKEQADLFGEGNNAFRRLTNLGKDVVRLMLDEKVGRRILLDVNGLSIPARKWIYEEYNNMRYHGDTVPIIASGMPIHGEGWGHVDMNNRRANLNRYQGIYEPYLSREDLRAIFDSRGLIGIPLDKNLLATGNKFEAELAQQHPGSANYRKTVVKIIAAQMLRAVQVVQDREIWNYLSLSSSFDGLSRPFPGFEDARTLDDLRDGMLEFFQNPEDIFDLYTAKQVRQFMYDYEAATLVEKIFSRNAQEFVSRNFPKKKGP